MYYIKLFIMIKYIVLTIAISNICKIPNGIISYNKTEINNLIIQPQYQVNRFYGNFDKGYFYIIINTPNCNNYSNYKFIESSLFYNYNNRYYNYSSYAIKYINNMDVLDLQWHKWRIKKNINQIKIYTDIGNISIQTKIGIQPQGISEDGFVRSGSEIDNTAYSYNILDGIYTGSILNEKINSNGYFEFVQTSYNLLKNKNSSWICTYLFSSKFHGFTCMGLNNTYSKYAHGMIIYDNKRYWLPQWAFLITNPTCSRHSTISNYTFSLCCFITSTIFLYVGQSMMQPNTSSTALQSS